MRGRNLGMSKAMALDTLGNAYLYLRETYSTTRLSGVEGQALMDAAWVLGDAFKSAKSEFNLSDFTITHEDRG